MDDIFKYSSGLNRDFYAILQVEKTASLKEIQRAYKRLALQYHPDKTTDPEAKEIFQTVKRAYDILSDDKKKRIYDEYGEKGVSMVESMGEVAPFIDPDVIHFMNWIFFIGSCLVALMILFPAFVSLKAEKKVDWTWVNVFIPAFILDAIILLALLARPSQVQQEGEEQTDENGQKLKKELLISKWFTVIYFVLLIIFQVFLATKLDDKFDGSWWKVFTPLLLMEVSNFVDLLYTVSSTFKNGFVDISYKEDGTREIHAAPFTIYEKSSILLDTFGMWMLRVTQITLICLKLSSQIESSWALVFIPTWLWGFFKIASIFLMSLDSTKPSKRMTIQSSIVGFITSALFIYLTFGMLASSLDSGSPKTSVILIPVFIVTGTLFCCVGCCLPCMVTSVRRTLAQELKSGNQMQVSVERRIEAGSSSSS
jgi:hypothetical protein